MASRDLASDIKLTQVVVPAVKTTTTTSSAIDTAGYESLTVLFDMGNSGDTLSGTLYWTLSLTECDTSGGSYTAVADADIVGGTNSYVIDAPAEDSLAVKFGYIGNKRYVKGVATATGSHSSGTPIGIVAILGHAQNAPVA